MPGERFLDHYLPYLLRQADQTLSAPFYAALVERGVARSEWRVLAVLAELGELSVAELTAAALSPQPTVTHALRRLEERGLVRRTEGVEDRRRRFVSVTPEGAELTAELTAEARALEAELLDEAGDLTELMDQLRTMTASIEAKSRVTAERSREVSRQANRGQSGPSSERMRRPTARWGAASRKRDQSGGSA